MRLNTRFNTGERDYNDRPIAWLKLIGAKFKIAELTWRSIKRAMPLAYSIVIVTICPPTLAVDGQDRLDEVIVTSQRRPQYLIEHAGNIDRLSHEELTQVRHVHLHELLTRVSGVWLSRGSGLSLFRY